MDGRLFRTFSRLLSRPGALTVEWTEGKRARSLPPFRAYLVASVFFFSVSFLFGIPSQEGALSAEVPDLSPFGSTNEVLRDAVEAKSQAILTLGVLAMVPLFAFWLWLIHSKKTGASVAHLVFSLHQHAAILLLLGLIWPLMFLVSPWVWIVVMAGAGTHVFLAYRQVYRGRAWVLRGVASGVGWCVLLISGFVGLGPGVIGPLESSAREIMQREHAHLMYVSSTSEVARADTAVENTLRRFALAFFTGVDDGFFLGHDSVHLAELLVDHRSDPDQGFDEEYLTAWTDSIIGGLLVDQAGDFTVRGIAMTFALQQGDTLGALSHAQALTGLAAPTGDHARRAQAYRDAAEALLASSDTR